MNKDVECGLTSDQLHIIEKCCGVNPVDFNESNDIVYTDQGNFTVCNIIGKYNTIQTGVAKRRPDDDESNAARHNISFMRAIKSDSITFSI